MEREPEYCTYMHFIFSGSSYWHCSEYSSSLFHLLSVRNLQPSFLLLLVLVVPISSDCAVILSCAPHCYSCPVMFLPLILLPCCFSPWHSLLLLLVLSSFMFPLQELMSSWTRLLSLFPLLSFDSWPLVHAKHGKNLGAHFRLWATSFHNIS